MELPPVEADEAVAAVFAQWKLVPGLSLGGFQISAIGRAQGGPVIALAQGETQVHLRFVSASDSPKFARIDGVDVVHSPLDEAAARRVGDLLRGVCDSLRRSGAGPSLLCLIRQPPPAPPPPAVKEPQPEAYSGSDAPELDPSLRADPARSFMRFETIDLADVSRFPDAIAQMFAGSFGGLVIRGVYSKEAMASVMARLQRDGNAFPRTSFPARFKAHFLGRCLDGSDPELGEYLADATRFRERTLEAFRGYAPFEGRIEELLGKLAGGRGVRVPRFRDGRPYSSATVRYLLEGGQIGTHCGNEASTRPAYTHLNSLVDRDDQLSYFLTLQEPLAGGELIVYSLKWSDIDASRIVNGRSEVNELLEQAQWLAVTPRAGDLLIFDGGRWFHRVARVEGPRERWTIGGFMMFDRERANVLYWS